MGGSFLSKIHFIKKKKNVEQINIVNDNLDKKQKIDKNDKITKFSSETEIYEFIRKYNKWGEIYEKQLNEDLIVYYSSFFMETNYAKEILTRLENEFNPSEYFSKLQTKYLIYGIPELKNCINATLVPIYFKTIYYQITTDKKTNNNISFHQICISGTNSKLVKKAIQTISLYKLNQYQ